MPESYFDVAPAMTGGYRVVYIKAAGLQHQVIIETAGDVAAAARLCMVAVLSDAPEIRARCRALGIRLLDPPQRRNGGAHG